MPTLKPAYLIHGDDHGAVGERRGRLRALAEELGGGGAVEVLSGEAATPSGVAAALATMTLGLGAEGEAGIGRVILVDGVERWRERDVAEQLAPALGAISPGTTVALFAREEARAKAPDALHDAVSRAGGQVVAQMTAKRWELPKWVREQASRMGLALDASAAKLLVALVGERQQRLLRELEKLALEAEESRPSGTVTIDAAAIEERAARSAEWQAYALGDALVAADRPAAMRAYLRLREQGERPAGLVYVLAQRMREALAVSERLRAGESAAEVRRTLRMPSKAAERLIAEAGRSDPGRLRGALRELARLELDSRGGSLVTAGRVSRAAMNEDTIAHCAIEVITGA